MSLITRQLEEVWSALRVSENQRRHVLQEVRLRNLRGIKDLRVPFSYPVSVLAGPNGCGKSTVLFACACAYSVPGRGPKEFVPSSLFPNFTDRLGLAGALSDAAERTELEFHYLHDGERLSMVWKRGKTWNRSFMGRKGGKRPKRSLYLRTLGNLTNPSEVRSVLQIGRKQYQAEHLTSDLLIFAHRILRKRYQRLSVISAQARDLLFAEVEGEGDVRYSEFHMSSGERTILRMSKDISHLEDALILIDEVDTGLHPYTQQQLMLELQRIALRRRLQIIVASHSPVILDSVPPEGRKFLDRDERTTEVRLIPAYRDILQKSLYGQSREQLSILCEDEVAEGVIFGVLDVLQSRKGLRHEDFVIGRDTGRDEFPSHVRTLGKFGRLKDFVFVLDGDARHMEERIKAIAEEYGHSVQPLFLPGTASPEDWIWEILQRNARDYSKSLGLSPSDMEGKMQDIARMMEGAVHQRHPAKANLEAFASEIGRSPSEIGRIVGRHETERHGEGIVEFLVQLEEQIDAWWRL